MKIYDVEVSSLQRTIKNLNARIARVQANNGDDTNQILQEMISNIPSVSQLNVDNKLVTLTTAGGKISRNLENISNMTESEFRDFQAELDSITGFLNSRDLIGKLESGESFNPKDVWLAVDYAREKGTPPDSGTVKSIVDALTDKSDDDTFLDTIRSIFEVSSGRMGVGEFDEYYDSLQGLM